MRSGLHLGVSATRVQQLCAAAERRLVVAARRGALGHRGNLPLHTCAPAIPCLVPAGLRSALDLPLECLDLSVRSRAGLSNRGIETIGQLVQRSATEIHEFPHLGARSLREIVAALARIGLHVGMRVRADDGAGDGCEAA